MISFDGQWFPGRIYLEVVARCLLVQLVYHCVRLKLDQDEEELQKKIKKRPINGNILKYAPFLLDHCDMITTIEIWISLKPGLCHWQKRESRCCQTVDQTISYYPSFPERGFQLNHHNCQRGHFFWSSWRFVFSNHHYCQRCCVTFLKLIALVRFELFTWATSLLSTSWSQLESDQVSW